MTRIPGLAALAAVAVLAAAPAVLADTLQVPADFAGIQAAVDAAGEGDTVLIAPGTYVGSFTIGGKTDLEIRGAGRGVVISTATVTVNGSSTGILVRGLEFENAGITVLGGGDVTLTRLKFTGGTYAIGSGGVAGLVISKCTFLQTTGTAVSDIDSTGFVLEKCRFEDIADYAVILSPDNGVGTQAAVLAKNRLVSCGSGFGLSGADAVVEKNRMEGLAGYGINTNGFLAVDRAKISKNRIETSGSVAIGGAYDSFLVEKNVLVGGGIQFSGAFHLLDRNRVTGAPGAGIAVVTNATLTGNTVKGAGGAGIHVGGNSCVLEGNTVADVNGNGIEIFGGGCDILKNTVTGADVNGFLIAGTGHFLVRNRASGNGFNDLADFSAEGVNDYDHNRFGVVTFSYID